MIFLLNAYTNAGCLFSDVSHSVPSVAETNRTFLIQDGFAKHASVGFSLPGTPVVKGEDYRSWLPEVDISPH